MIQYTPLTSEEKVKILEQKCQSESMTNSSARNVILVYKQHGIVMQLLF